MHTYIYTDSTDVMSLYIHRQTDRLAGTQPDRQAGRQADMHTSIHLHTHTNIRRYIYIRADAVHPHPSQSFATSSADFMLCPSLGLLFPGSGAACNTPQPQTQDSRDSRGLDVCRSSNQLELSTSLLQALNLRDPTASCLHKGRTVDHYNRGMVLCKQALVLSVWETQDSGV